LAWCGATLAGWTGLEYEEPGAQVATAMFVVINLSIVLLAIARIRSLRFAGDRRRGERFRTSTQAALGDADVSLAEVSLVDVSLSGALVTTRRAEPIAARGELLFDLPSGPLSLWVVERSRREVSPAGTYLVGLEFEPHQPDELATLSSALFGTTAERRARTIRAA
jgi:hypothetical protein